MGQQHDVRCLQCGEEFVVCDGGGFFFHLLHCDRCGKEKEIGFDELGELHLRYIKGLPGPYCIATREHDKAIQENYEGEPLSEDEYRSAIERSVPRHSRCGGRFRFDAPPRCPKCGSTEFEDTGRGVLCYD